MKTTVYKIGTLLKLLVIGILTILRNIETSRDDFIFYSERLMRRTFEYALSFLPHCDVNVTMPSGESYVGKKFAGQGLCGVSILRAGETMEKALMKVTKDIRLGKILIQTNEHGEPLLHYCRLPANKVKDYVANGVQSSLIKTPKYKNNNVMSIRL